MGYATPAQCKAEFKDLTVEDTGTAISTSDLAQFISDADAEINSYLAVKYTVPITGTEALKVISMCEVWLVKHRILDVIAVKTGQERTSQTGGKTYREMALEILKGIAKGTTLLLDGSVPLNGSTTFHGGVQSYSSENGIEHIFDRARDQW